MKKFAIKMPTAFFDTNNPVATPGPVDAAEGLSDSTLSFANGSMKMGQGRAFAIGNEESARPARMTPAAFLASITNAAQRASAKGTPTYKRWFQLQGRNFLMEEVPYRRVAAQLKQLPPWTGRLDAVSTNLLAADSFLDAIPARLLTAYSSGTPGGTRTMRLSKLDWDKTRAVVLDYAVVVNNYETDYTFQSGGTYYVSGPCFLDNITVAGGAVIKYANLNSQIFGQPGLWSYNAACLQVLGSVTCSTNANRPAIFTAADDDTVGEIISGSTGQPAGNFYANPAIFSPNDVTISNVRIRYAAQAVNVWDNCNITMWDSQVTDSGVLAVLGSGYGSSSSVSLTCNNCLFSGAYYGVLVMDYGTVPNTYNLNNCTFDNVYCLAGAGNYYSARYAVNCIFADSGYPGYGTWQGANNGFYNSPYLGAFGSNPITVSTSPFHAPVGNENYYLLASSTFHKAGTTTGVDPTLLADLQTATTYAPQDGSIPDSESPGPDLGYHYPINEDFDGDDLPDWWQMEWFGNLVHYGSDSDAASGLTLLQDYNANPQADPNIIRFLSITVANNYVNYQSVPAQLAVLNYPRYIAIVVDDTNYTADAVWNAYSSANVTIPLGPVQGWHEVWIGLRGYADNPNNAVWQWKRLKLDTTPPQLVITNPVSTSVDRPVIQLQGIANEALQAISYDITNACGLATNQQMMIIGQAYATNTAEFTTNYFQAYDLPLTNGVNTIRLHATDLAGNVSTLTTSLTLDYSAKTNPPVVQLLWPQNGMEIVGSGIVCRGQLSDDTATVTVQLVDANGNTNTVGSLVGRDGVFYSGSLTLATGANHLNYTVTDAAGNVAATNIVVSTSSLGLTLDPVAAGQALVTGTIDNTNYTVYVNGMQATNTGGGHWSATITPIGVSGGAVVANAVLGGGDPTAQQIDQAPQGVYISQYQEHDEEDYDYLAFEQSDPPPYCWKNTGTVNWQDGRPGGYVYWAGLGGGANTTDCFMNWPATSWPQPLPTGPATGIIFNASGQSVWSNTSVCYPPPLPQEHCDVYEPIWAGISTERRTADTEMKLATGGPPGSRQKNLWCISATVTAYTNLNDSIGTPVPPEQVQIGSFGHLDASGNLWVVLPDNDPETVTPMVAGIR